MCRRGGGSVVDSALYVAREVGGSAKSRQTANTVSKGFLDYHGVAPTMIPLIVDPGSMC